MNELSENGMLYDISEAVRTLNKVEGFEPKDYLRKEEPRYPQEAYRKIPQYP